LETFQKLESTISLKKSACLMTKLIAGKGKDAESIGGVLRMKVDHLRVIHRRLCSQRCHVDDQADPPSGQTKSM
jgi:hypothetical protein